MRKVLSAITIALLIASLIPVHSSIHANTNISLMNKTELVKAIAAKA